jgi:hypothetical protein
MHHTYLNTGLQSGRWIFFPGYFFLGSKPFDNQPIELNGAIYALCGILKIVVASAAKAELGALFMNIKDGVILRLILAEIRPQTTTDARPLRQPNRHQHCQRHRQETTLPVNGDALFLDWRPSQTPILQSILAPGPRKLSRLLHQALWR